MSGSYKELPERGIVSITSLNPAVVVTNEPNRAVNVALDSSKITAGGALNITQTYVAGETISALKAVYINSVDSKIYLANPSTLQTASVSGITKTAGNIGDSIEIVQYGPLQDSFLTFANAEIICLGNNGVMTNSQPTTGYLTRLGRSVNSNTILITLEQPIQL